MKSLKNLLYENLNINKIEKFLEKSTNVRKYADKYNIDYDIMHILFIYINNELLNARNLDKAYKDILDTFSDEEELTNLLNSEKDAEKLIDIDFDEFLTDLFNNFK